MPQTGQASVSPDQGADRLTHSTTVSERPQASPLVPRLGLWLGLVSLLGVAGLIALYRGQATAAPLADPLLVVSTTLPILTPRLALAQPEQPILVRNETAQALDLRTTPHAPASVHLRVPAWSTARLALTVPGLYHLYDAATAAVTDYKAGNDVVQERRRSPPPALPDQGWIIVSATHDLPSDAHINVPKRADLFNPRATVMQVGGALIVHNYDSDAHNIVSDSVDPSGFAFELFGTDDEPTTQGSERRMTLYIPGLYHLYCSMHTRVTGTRGGWHIVAPLDRSASGYHDNDPMDAWVLVLPTQTT